MLIKNPIRESDQLLMLKIRFGALSLLYKTALVEKHIFFFFFLLFYILNGSILF